MTEGLHIDTGGGASGGMVRVQGALSGEELMALPRGDWVNQATWSEGDRRILVASWEGTARVCCGTMTELWSSGA